MDRDLHDITSAGASRFGWRRLLLGLGLLGLCAGCGVGERREAPEEPAPVTDTDTASEFSWPAGDGPIAVLHIRDLGELRIALYPELAPQTVENFVKLANEKYYDGTTFHRVIPGLCIQGGSPATRDSDPYNDPHGGPGYTIADEFSEAPHLRGVLAMANSGKKDSAGSQFFIVHEDRTDLDGSYSVFGRVIEGIELVDAVTQVEIDKAGRWGSANRPIENVVIERLRIEPGREGHARSAGEGSTPEPLS